MERCCLSNPKNAVGRPRNSDHGSARNRPLDKGCLKVLNEVRPTGIFANIQNTSIRRTPVNSWQSGGFRTSDIVYSYSVNC